MIVFLDTSVVLRKFLGERNPFKGWAKWDQAFASELLRVEYFRVVDRLRLQGSVDDTARMQLQRAFDVFWETCHRIPVSPVVLDRAAGSFPTVLGTLDAIHLATARWVDESLDQPVTLVTHDRQLAIASLAVGLPVLPEFD